MFWSRGTTLLAASVASLAIINRFSSISADVCDDVADILDLDNILPLGGVDTTIELDPSVTTLECPTNDDEDELLDEIVVSGGQLTISSNSTVRFVNLRFTVENDSELIFDMPKTKFGPNGGGVDVESLSGYSLHVMEGGSAIFMGKFGGWQVDNVGSIFHNSGSLEFKGNAKFQNNRNVFNSNEGSLKFRGKTWFNDNSLLAINNEGPDAFVRFSKDAVFQDNGDGYDGATGCSVWNDEGNVVFRGDAYFKDHGCFEGSAVANGGRMRFYGKARFTDNKNSEAWGGGLINENGTVVFKSATQFNNNQALVGGGMAITGGEVTFKKAAMFDGNIATENGGAFSLTIGGQISNDDYVTPSSLTFEKPSVVRYSDNEAPVNACTLAYVEDGTTLVGFDVDDVCLENTE